MLPAQPKGNVVHIGRAWEPGEEDFLPKGWDWEVCYYADDPKDPADWSGDVIVTRLDGSGKVAERRALVGCLVRDLSYHALALAMEMGLNIATPCRGRRIPGWVPYHGWQD